MNNTKLEAALGSAPSGGHFSTEGFYRNPERYYEAMMAQTTPLTLDDIEVGMRIFTYNEGNDVVFVEGEVVAINRDSENPLLGVEPTVTLRTADQSEMEIHCFMLGLSNIWQVRVPSYTFILPKVV